MTQLESMTDDTHAQLQTHIEAILALLSQDATVNDELQETPDRFASLLLDRFVPRQRSTLRALPTQATANGPIVLCDIPYHALCAHHIVPFFGTAHIAYLPGQHIAGFGAFTRLVDELSRGPQLQEKLVQDIADAIAQDLKPAGVLVRLQARQMCMELTGHHGVSNTIAYAARGAFAGEQMHQHAQALFADAAT